MSGELALAVDVGTSSVRAVVLDVEGRAARPSVRVPYSVTPTQRGGENFDAFDLLRRVTQAIDDVDAAGVTVVGVSCFWHSLMGADETLEPVSELLSWAFTGADGAAASLASELDPASVHARTGARLHSSFWPAKLRWLAAERDHQWARARWWTGFAEWLFARLFDRHPVASTAMASGTGLMDLARCDWDDDLLRAAGAQREQLPEISDAPWRGLAPAYAQRWPHLAEIPWVPAFGDGACSNIGVGAYGPDRAAINVGTSAALRVVWAGEPVAPPPGLWCYRLDRRRLVMGGALSNAGNLYRWLATTLQLPADAEAHIADRPADCHGLTLLPLLAGERSPGYSPDAAGAIIGLRHATTGLDILQAGMEAVGLRCRTVWDELRAAHPAARTLLASGGGMTNSPLWRQIIADALDHPLVASAEREASARGAGLLALEAVGAQVDLRRARTGEIHEPAPAAAAALAGARARQERLYDMLIASKGAVHA